MDWNEIKKYVSDDEIFIEADHEYLQYSGRIDDRDPKAPGFVFPCTSVTTKFIGSSVKVILSNQRACYLNYLGVIIDGKQQKILLPEQGVTVITVADGLEDTQHDLVIFKRMDCTHVVTIYGLIINKGGSLSMPAPKPARRMEFYGDSVTAGEVSEAVEYVGKQDPVHNGEYSNSYYSYAWMTARKLNAQIHDIAQGGIALLDGTGWFDYPDFCGMESVYNKVRFHRGLGDMTLWDFERYTPHVVVVAIGQNDNHPIDYMKANYYSEVSNHWRKHYQIFIEKLRATYQSAYIVLTTTILGHDESWDRAIDEVCQRINDPKIRHFLYTKNGCGTPGHIRIPEAEEMSEELAAYIETLGEDVWKEV